MVDYIKREKKDIFNIPFLQFFFKNKKFLFLLRIFTAFVFFYAIVYGFINQDKSNIFTSGIFWSLFWSFFMVCTLPLFGRIFCGICPHGFIGKYITKIGLNKTMPKFLQNRFIGIFLLVFVWWGFYYTFPGLFKTPLGTALMFTVLTLLAFVIYFIYKNMSYCKYICPIGTLTRAYDKLAPTKLQTYSSACKTCKTFECATACSYNLKPFTFEKKNSSEDCTLCMDCAVSCEAVAFNIVPPSKKLEGKFKTLSFEVWSYILILASIPVSMTFAHGLQRSKIANEMIWNKTASFFALEHLNGMFAFLYAILFTVVIALVGIYLASKVLKKDFTYTFNTLGYAYAPLFIFGSLAHTLESFLTRGYAKIINGFSQAFSLDIEVISLFSKSDTWLHYFSFFREFAIVFTLYLIYIRLKQVDASTIRKSLAYFFLCFLLIFFISINVYKAYIFKTYGVEKRSHNMANMQTKTIQSKKHEH